VSKFFYGGYVLENYSGTKPHTHNNIGKTIVNTLMVARLNEFSETREY
jgi:hypothetical protein